MGIYSGLKRLFLCNAIVTFLPLIQVLEATLKEIGRRMTLIEVSYI